MHNFQYQVIFCKWSFWYWQYFIWYSCRIFWFKNVLLLLINVKVAACYGKSQDGWWEKYIYVVWSCQLFLKYAYRRQLLICHNPQPINEMNTCMCKYIHLYLMTRTKGLATHVVNLPVTGFDRSVRYRSVFNAKLGRHSWTFGTQLCIDRVDYNNYAYIKLIKWK